MKQFSTAETLIIAFLYSFAYIIVVAFIYQILALISEGLAVVVAFVASVAYINFMFFDK